MMEIIDAKLSSCCKSSVSSHPGDSNIGFHYTCNGCRKICNMIEVPYWELTDKGKYKRINESK